MSFLIPRFRIAIANSAGDAVSFYRLGYVDSLNKITALKDVECFDTAPVNSILALKSHRSYCEPPITNICFV